MSVFTNKAMTSKLPASNASHMLRRNNNLHLLEFLLGTISSQSPLSLLRGNTFLIRMIWTMVCEEWWDLHIDRTFMNVSMKNWKGSICNLCKDQGKESSDERESDFEEDSDDDDPDDGMEWHDYRQYPKNRSRSGGCPVATVAENVRFPDPRQVPLGTFEHQESEHLYINMMPIKGTDKKSVPRYCQQYWPLIEKCMQLVTPGPEPKNEDWIVYLTIDERPAKQGQSQRRGGLHVESPGILPVFDSSVMNMRECKDKSSGFYYNKNNEALQRMKSHHSFVAGGMFLPGAEHHWGGGMMMRHEHIEGGIFMGSTVSNSCAVWNCRILDTTGEIIGAHGDIEKLRPLLGPPAKTLESGELIWMTDKTPHESLPLPAGVTQRQYFRLVVGSVTAWFADHSTSNPLGIKPPKSVRIVRGNKFDVYSKLSDHMSSRWTCGSKETITAIQDEMEVRRLAAKFSVGHMSERMLLYGITSVDRLLELTAQQDNDSLSCWQRWGSRYSKDGMQMFLHYNSSYSDQPRFTKLVDYVIENNRAKYHEYLTKKKK